MNYQAFSLLLLGEFYQQDLAVQEGLTLVVLLAETRRNYSSVNLEAGWQQELVHTST